jgi:DNA-binding protein H-NS
MVAKSEFHKFKIQDHSYVPAMLALKKHVDEQLQPIQQARERRSMEHQQKHERFHNDFSQAKTTEDLSALSENRPPSLGGQRTTSSSQRSSRRPE